MTRCLKLLFVVVCLTSSTAWAGKPTVDQILQRRFTRVAGGAARQACVFPTTKVSFCDQAVSSPTVVFDGKLYRMWFVGLTKTSDPSIPYGYAERLGLATSRDGVNWKIANGGKPVLDFGPEGKFDDRGLAHPFVLKVGDKFMLWYGGIDGRSGKDVGDGPKHVRVEQIGLAISKDGVNWQRANNGDPVLKNGPKGTIDSVQATGCHIIRRGSEYVMWYGAYNGVHTIGLATSPDGIHWTKQNGGKSLPGLKPPKQLGPSVYFDGQKYLMLYNTIRPTPKNGGTQWTLYAATSSDGIHWQQAQQNRPVLGPAPPDNFASADGKVGNNHCVHPSKFLFINGRLRIFFGGEGNKPLPGRRYAPAAVGLMEMTFK